MITELLFFTTAHFVLSVFTGFVFFAAGLLFFDAGQIDKRKRMPILRSVGFFLLAAVAAVHILPISLLPITTFIQFIHVAGLLFIFFSLVNEPILHKPESRSWLFVPLSLSAISFVFVPLAAILMFLISFWYLRRSTEGLDKQLRPAAFAFFCLGLAELLQLSFFWSDTAAVFWSKALAVYGPVWITQHILEVLGISTLAVWVWGYIRFRLQIQLFVTIFASTLVIFFITTFFFTFLLLKNLEADALSHLKTNVKVLHYAIDSLQSETLAHAKALAHDSALQAALRQENTAALATISSEYLLSQNLSFLTIANASGEVLMRGEDREKIGDSISEDPAVKSALAGQPLATIVSNNGITAPEVVVKAVSPMRDPETKKILGIVATGFVIDSAFVDGVKDVTGLDATIFGGDKRAATTFIAPDGKSRFVGTIETNKKITTSVLEKSELYVGTSSVLNQPYYTAYSPLKTHGDTTIGMLFVGKPQLTLLAAAQKSIDLTFLGSLILIILATIPCYFLSKYIKEHVEA